MDPQPAAPPVVAVVVTSDAGPWLEEALSALGAQDYPSLSVLVIDAASAADPTPRVAEVLPNAYIRRLQENRGYGATVNEVLNMVEGASFLLLCHDDVAPEPNAVRLLVEEALRSNAGIVGPKLVSWDDPEVLLQVGLSADRTGHPTPMIERGELDQSQHDAVRDVFAVPGGCILVRQDLFDELGGFDPAMTLLGDDLDLCWRAQVVGARVLVAPQARVRHREALAARRPVDDRRRLQARHRIRSLLKCYSALHLLRAVPIALALGLAEIVYALLAGRRDQAADVATAWAWNARSFGDLRAARRAAQKRRRVPDRDVARLQAGRNARLRAFLRGPDSGVGGAQAITAAGRDLLGTMRAGPRRSFIAVWAAILVALVIGSRDVLGGHIPAVGRLAPFPDHASTFLRHFLSGWRFSGLGAEEPAPTAFGLLGVAGALLLGGMGVLQKLLTVGMLFTGVAGAWRLSRPLTGGTGRARLVAPVVYAAVPLPYNALAEGRWSGLIAYAVLPFVLARLLAATGLEPFGGDRRPLRDQAVVLGLLTAAAAALAPPLAIVVPLVALLLVAGSLLAGGVDAAGRAVTVAAGAAVAAAVLCFPWVLAFVLPGGEWAPFAGVRPAEPPGLGALLRFETGPLGAPPLGWAFVVAAALPLIVGRDWRLAWAIRLWVVALGCTGLAWAGGRDWLPLDVPAPELLLAPAAIALTLTVALGMSAFDIDLRGYRFGWRQAASVVTAFAVVVGTLPVLGAAAGGRWHLAESDHATALAWMAEEGRRADFRVLWIGDPRVLPLDGWELDEGVAYAMSRDGTPTAVDLWPASSDGATRLVPDAIGVARRGGTTRLGRLLAPMGIRYIVLPERVAPDEDADRHPPPEDIGAALAAQLDLKALQADPSLTVYQNVAAAPARAALAPGTNVADAPLGADLSTSLPVLPSASDATSFDGRVPAAPVLLAEASSSRWRMEVDGEVVARSKAFGWANAFDVRTAGDAAMSYRTPVVDRALLGLQLLLWVLALRWALRHRRSAAGRDEETA